MRLRQLKRCTGRAFGANAALVIVLTATVLTATSGCSLVAGKVSVESLSSLGPRGNESILRGQLVEACTENSALSAPRFTSTASEVQIGSRIELAVESPHCPVDFVRVGVGEIGTDGTFESFAVGIAAITLQDSGGSSTKTTINVFVPAGKNEPNDPYYSGTAGLSQPGYSMIQAPRAWKLKTDCRGIGIAVIDTGVDLGTDPATTGHPDLLPNLGNPYEIDEDGLDNDGNGFVDDAYGANFVGVGEATNLLVDNDSHGTHVAGTIGAASNNGAGAAGICWNANIVAAKFIDNNGGSIGDAVEAITYISRLPWIRVSNNSWGGSGNSTLLRNAIAASGDAGQLFIAAAGNGGADENGDDNDATPEFPASFSLPNILSVAALDRNRQLAPFSNFGAASVHIAAPGVDIVSTYPAGQYGSKDGTSMATPHVTGAVALLWAFNPKLTPAQVRKRILDSADVTPGLLGNKVQGNRQLNLFRALTGL